MLSSALLAACASEIAPPAGPPIVPTGATLSPDGFVSVDAVPEPPAEWSPFRKPASPWPGTRKPDYIDGVESLFRVSQRGGPPPGSPYVQPQHSGRTFVEDGCIYIASYNGTKALLEVDKSHSVGLDPQGYLALLDRAGHVWVRLGTPVTFSGGGTPGPASAAMKAACDHDTALWTPEISNFPYEARPR